MTIDPKTEQRRQDYLDALFLLDGRNNPAHPHHATYTGLYQARQAELQERDANLLLGEDF